MDNLFEALLWLLAISGGFAVLALIAEGVERFAEWADEMFTKYDL